MATEFTRHNIASTGTNIAKVYEYANGERLQPVINPEAQEEYEAAFREYFAYCSRALTDEQVLSLIENGDIGKPFGLFDDDFIKLVGKARRISRSGYYLLPNERKLILGFWGSVVSEDNKQVPEDKKHTWIASQKLKFCSEDGYEDWTFGEKIQYQPNRVNLYGYRTLGPSDVLRANSVGPFVLGVDYVFDSLSRQIDKEKIRRSMELQRVVDITQAFGQANGILKGVLGDK